MSPRHSVVTRLLGFAFLLLASIILVVVRSDAEVDNGLLIGSVIAFPAAALKGVGVGKTLQECLRRVLRSLQQELNF